MNTPRTPASSPAPPATSAACSSHACSTSAHPSGPWPAPLTPLRCQTRSSSRPASSPPFPGTCSTASVPLSSSRRRAQRSSPPPPQRAYPGWCCCPRSPRRSSTGETAARRARCTTAPSSRRPRLRHVVDDPAPGHLRQQPARLGPAGRSRPDPGGSGCGVIPYSAGGRGHGPAVVAGRSMRRHVAPPSAVA